jgi:hypothetical protein
MKKAHRVCRGAKQLRSGVCLGWLQERKGGQVGGHVK